MICDIEEKTLKPATPNSGAWGVGMADPVPDNAWNKNKEEHPMKSESSFMELMSEELAKDLQQREEQTLLDKTAPKSESDSNHLDQGNTTDTSNDLMLALMLQHDFNKEHDSQIQREEKHFNKNSKLSVSFSKYKVCPTTYESDSDDENYNIDDEHRVLDSFEASRLSDPVIPACGYTRHNNVMVTKHDKILSGRKNAERIMNFPPGINTGDAGGFDMQISNKVYNKLARSAMNETRRKHRVQDKVDKATSDKALDPMTRLIIYKIVNNSILETVNGIVSTGKESVVFHAYGGGTYKDVELSEECAVKVFKTSLTDFKTREKYIRGDYRFKDRLSKNNNKMILQLWAEKEYHNLRRLKKAKIPSPTPFHVKKHVLVMSFIGEGQIAAPKLKHVRLTAEQWRGAYQEVVKIMTTMFRGCKLVHGDLSEYNLLWHEEKCWIIDLGQAVEPVHKHALHFLHRDCSNVVRFFKSKDVPNLPSPLQLFKIVTGIDLDGQEDEAERLLDDYEKSQELYTNRCSSVDDPFEFLWNDIQREERNRIRQRKEEEEEDLDENVESPDFPILQNTIVKTTSAEPVTTKTKKKKKRKKQSTKALNVAPEGEGPVGDFVYVACEGSKRGERTSGGPPGADFGIK